MNTSYLWFIAVAVIAALLGYVIGKRDRRLRRQKLVGLLANPYFEGVNDLLKGQPDSATSLFTDLFPVNEQTLDTHLLIAQHHSERGNAQQAIRIYRQLIDAAQQAHLASWSDQSQLGLAQAYMRLGLYEQCGEILLDIISSLESDERAVAIREYCQMKSAALDWAGALPVARQLLQLPDEQRKESDHILLANLLCQEAELAMGLDQQSVQLQAGSPLPEQAKELIAEALSVCPQSTRVRYLAAVASYIDGQTDLMFDHCLEAVSSEPHMVPTLVRLITDALGQNSPQTRELLALLRKIPEASVATSLHYIKLLQEEGDIEQAKELVATLLDGSPNMMVVFRSIELHLLQAPDQESEEMRLMYKRIHEWTSREERYLCNKCGFLSVQNYWRCPSCLGWSTVVPLQLEQSLHLSPNN